MTVLDEPYPLPLPDLSGTDAAFVRAPDRPDGSFVNPWPTPPMVGPRDVLRWKVTQTNPFASVKRSRAPWLPTVRDASDTWRAVPGGLRVQWLGHASFLVELDGVHILIDPVFGTAGPGVFRAVPPPRLPDHLPRIDAVLLTHGHYDHLDRRSVDAICRRWPDARVVVPRGQAKSLPRSARDVTALTWFEAVRVRHVECVLTPAQHWHLRRPWDRNRALWGGYMVRGPERADGSRPSVYHTGDTGWFDGFRVIKAVLGAPDVALLPLGAYEPRWFMGGQHMPPEDSVQAFLDLEAGHFVGMHWGTFDLSDEPIDQGPRDILPTQLDRRDLAPDRVHVMSHGGVLSVGADGAVTGVAGRNALPLL